MGGRRGFAGEQRAGGGELADDIRGRPAGGDLEAHRLPGSPRLRLRGAVPLGAAPVSRDVSVDNPTQFFVNALRSTLIAHGIDVRGPAVDIDDIRDAPARPDGAPLVSHRSPPLSTLALRLMKVSQNLYAETFLKTLGAGRVRTVHRAAGRSIALAALQAWGVGPDGLILRDGSGLSRYDYVTPEALVTILTHVDRQTSLKGPFEESAADRGPRRDAVEPHEGHGGRRQRAREDRVDGERARAVRLRHDGGWRAAGLLRSSPTISRRRRIQSTERPTRSSSGWRSSNDENVHLRVMSPGGPRGGAGAAPGVVAVVGSESGGRVHGRAVKAGG